jgi:hypothetical protein
MVWDAQKLGKLAQIDEACRRIVYGETPESKNEENFILWINLI